MIRPARRVHLTLPEWIAILTLTATILGGMVAVLLRVESRLTTVEVNQQNLTDSLNRLSSSIDVFAGAVSRLQAADAARQKPKAKAGPAPGP